MESGDVSRWCRICSNEFIVGIFIFGEEARRLFLQAKITKYLAFSVSVDDKLPKMICEECFKKIDSFHKFAQMALRNQDKLNKFVANNPNNGSGASEPMKVDDKSLLHTYLTKGFKEKDATPNPPPQVQHKESEVTEMEVRIDPMMILQCSTQNTDDDDCENDYGSGEESDTSDSNNEENYSSDLTCPFCPGTFNTEYDLQIHKLDHSDPNEDDKRENDEDEGKFACPICGKFISTKGNLKVHLETHRPKGKYECDICGRVFKTQCNLHRHKEYHGGIQYPCGVCGRVYPTNSTLRAHSITHSDLRPHKCPLCDKTFKRNQDLKFHINQHTGARPYQCPYCPKAFASSGNCFSHRKRMHPMEVERDREKAAKIMR